MISKQIDKLMKKLKTDRNTFLTYILTLATFYIIVDRIFEMLLIIINGIGSNYWGPITYAIAFAICVFAFLFSFSSKFTKGSLYKLKFFYMYCIALYIIGISMIVQICNQVMWILFLSVPNFPQIIKDFSDIVKPAFTSIAIYFPLVTFYSLFRWLYTVINDTKNLVDSIQDFGGINLSNKNEGYGPHTCEIIICTNNKTGKPVITPELKRFESTLIVGVSGAGKTTTVFEPMIARDIEKKRFLKEASKEFAFNTLKAGLTTLTAPYDNEYINNNFSLNMITPKEDKIDLYKEYMKKLIHYSDSNGIIYKNLGITSISPDYESVSHILTVANNYNIKVNLIDPKSPESIGLNPFAVDDVSAVATTISSVLKALNISSHSSFDESFMENVSNQAVENLSILLKEMYPRLNDGLLPNLEDMLNLLHDFTLVENMCEKLKEDTELAEKYRLQIGYFEKNFYTNSTGKQETERYVYSAITQLDGLLRYEGIRNILCNRVNNINFDKAFENGEVNVVCTRRGELGVTAHKAFSMFFLLLMQHSVLKRPGTENSRIPHFLYIDEFSDFIGKATEPIFTLYRKYRCGVIITVQNLEQLKGDESKEIYGKNILSNCKTKIVFGDNIPSENDFWQKEFQDKREWRFSNTYDTEKESYDPKYANIAWVWISNYAAGKIQSQKFRGVIYKTKNMSGKTLVDAGKTNFLDDKFKKKQIDKNFDFEKFRNSRLIETDNSKTMFDKFSFKKVDFDMEDEIDPIQSNSNSDVFFNNGDAISFDYKKNK